MKDLLYNVAIPSLVQFGQNLNFTIHYLNFYTTLYHIYYFFPHAFDSFHSLWDKWLYEISKKKRERS